MGVRLGRVEVGRSERDHPAAARLERACPRRGAFRLHPVGRDTRCRVPDASPPRTTRAVPVVLLSTSPKRQVPRVRKRRETYALTMNKNSLFRRWLTSPTFSPLGL